MRTHRRPPLESPLPAAHDRSSRVVAACAACLALVAGCGADAPDGRNAAPAWHVEAMTSPASAGARFPSLATAPDGTVWMGWVTPKPAGGTVHASRFDGTAWTEPVVVTDSDRLFVNWADPPTIAVLADGRVAVTFAVRAGPAAWNVHVTSSDDDGRSWTDSVVLHDDRSATEHGFPTLVATPDGAAIAVWLDGAATADGGAMRLVARTWDGIDALGPETILDDRVCSCCNTTGTMAADGVPVVAYRDRTDAEIRDITAVRLEAVGVADRRRGTSVHDDGWEIAACPVNGPAIAADGDDVGVAWFTGAEGGPRGRVRAAWSRDGGRSFESPVELADDDLALGRVDVALLSDGGLAVVWLEEDHDGGWLRFTTVERNGTVGDSTSLAHGIGPGRGSGFPRLANLGDDLMLAWTAGKPPIAVARLRRGDVRD